MPDYAGEEVQEEAGGIAKEGAPILDARGVSCSTSSAAKTARRLRCQVPKRMRLD